MSSPVVVGGVAPHRLGFCQRCGDPISGKVRCTRCGGTSKEPRIRSTQALPAAKKSDPWANRYVNGDASFQSTGGDQDEEYLHNQPPPLSPKRASYDPALGFGMPSRISKDLRTSASLRTDLAGLDVKLGTSPNDRLSPAPMDAQPRRASQDYTAPVVKGSDGVLSKVCGSLVEPSTSRNKWACTDCATVFARDSTLYAAPASLQTNDGAYYCRDCYAKRYSLGDCRACGKDVLGSTKEDGKFVKASSGLWHGRCWKCTNCAKGARDGVEILIGMDGNPTCEGCFDKPRRSRAAPAAEETSSKQDLGLPDVRRLTRMGGTRNGPLGATIAELTKKLGQQSVSTSASPRIPFSSSFSSSRSSSNTSIPRSSSSQTSLDAANQPPAPRSPGKAKGPFSVAASPGKLPTGTMARSGSLSGSPPKPRPLTAQFRDGLNLAAFKPSFRGEVQDERLKRTDSRSRSVSPVKRPEWKLATSPARSQPSHSTFDGAEKRISPSSSLENDRAAPSKVPGSPSLPPHSSVLSVGGAALRSRSNKRLDVINNDVGEAGRRRTSSGFPRPLNSPFSKETDPVQPIQGEKSTREGRDDNNSSSSSSGDGELLPKSGLEPAEGSVRCAVCHLLPFERHNAFASTSSPPPQEVVMVTLGDNVHLHAECFRCSICQECIDGSKTFVRLSTPPTPSSPSSPPAAEGLAKYAHPHCSPIIQLRVVDTTTRGREDGKKSGGRSYRENLDPTSAMMGGGKEGLRSHATHQRELKPSPTPSPVSSMRSDREPTTRPSILPESVVSRNMLATHPLPQQQQQQQQQRRQTLTGVYAASNPTSPTTSSFPAAGKDAAVTTTTTTTTTVTMRRFQPTAGAAPPTRSTILPSPASSNPNVASYRGAMNPAAGIFSRMSALSSAASANSSSLVPTTTNLSEGDGGRGRGKFGGMQSCAFCGEKVSSLESVLGPRGTQWHKSCLVCRAPPPPPPSAHDARFFYHYGRKEKPKWCGKKLDSGAKVNRHGEVRCRDCYDRESSLFRIKG